MQISNSQQAGGNRLSAVKKMIFVLACVLVLTAGAASTKAARMQRPGKMVVVVANRLLLSDFADPSLRSVHKMIAGGSMAFISPNCAGPKTELSVILTAGAGMSCRGAVGMGECYDANEPVFGSVNGADVYYTRTGCRAGCGSAVFPGLGQVFRTNAQAGIDRLRVGALGDGVRRAGGHTCALGNADAYPDAIDRSVAVLAADSRGFIDVGRLNAAPVTHGVLQSPSGLFSDVSRLTREVKSSAGLADLVVVDFGDSVRLDDYKTELTDKAYAARKAIILHDLDRMLGELMAAPELKDARIALVSFSPPYSPSWNQLTPIVIYPTGSPGLLASASTRTPGLIAAIDFAPTLLHLMGASNMGEMVGQPAREVPAKDAIGALRDMDARVKANKTLIEPILWFFTICGLIPLTVAAVVLAFSLRVPRWALMVMRAGLMVGVSACLSMLLAVLMPAGNAGYIGGTTAAVAVILAVGFGAGSVLKHKTISFAVPVRVVFALTVIAVAVDAFTGCNLCKFALPSSYQLAGYRFYGVGNEYAGAVIVMAAMVALFSSQRARVWVTPALGIGLIVILGGGRLGANYGATVAAVVTFGLIGLAVWRSSFGARHVAAVLALGAALVVGLAVVEWRIAGMSGSHAGRVTYMVSKLGNRYLVAIVLRKVLLNITLTGSGTAVKAFLAFTPFLALWFYGIQGKVKQLFIKDPCMIAGLKAVVVGAVAGYLFNDSGVVMAGIILSMMIAILLYCLLETLDVDAGRGKIEQSRGA